MKRTLTTRQMARQPRGLRPEPYIDPPAASPFRSHVPLPEQRRQSASAAVGRRVALWAAVILGIGWVVATYAYRANWTATRSLNAAGQCAQIFAGYLAAHNYWSAEKQLSPTARRLHPPAAIKQDVAALESRYGPLISAQAASTAPRSVGGLQTCRTEYWLTFQHGFVPLHLVLARGYRTWSVESYSFG